MPKLFRQRPGVELIMIIVIMSLLSAIGVAILTTASSINTLSSREIRQQQLHAIAEAGVNYYRWHLAHYPDDYQDGTGAAGPYVHNYTDATGTVIGKFELTVTPPPNGSSIATIQSVGYLNSTPKAKRTVTIRLGIPSLSKYAVVANDNMRFGEGTEIFGPIHSNGGIRLDGLAHGLVTSAQSSYDDPDHIGGNEFGVHTHVNVGGGINNSFRPAEAPPSAVPDRSDVFLGSRQFPVTPIDFNGITIDLAGLITKAQASGIYLPPSGGQGYHLTLRTDDKIDMRIVNVQQRCQFRSGTGSCSFGICTRGICSIGQCSRRQCSNDPTRSCTRNSNCQGGGTCLPTASSCTTVAQCPSGATCQVNNACQNNGDCPSGGTCQISTCTASPQCPSGASCNINNSCTSDSNCTGGATCGNLKDFGYCSNNFNVICTQDATCGTGNSCILSSHSIGTAASDQSSFTYNSAPSLGVAIPANGIIFAADDLWVDGQIDASRLTIVAARDPLSTGQARIFLNKDLKYTNYDGRDSIGLIAQQDILVGYFSNDTIEIDAALIAQKGRVGRPYYGTGFIGATEPDSSFKIYPYGETNPSGGLTCREYRKRSSLTSKGSLATNQRYGFAWVGTAFSCGTDSNNSGYCDRILSYDSNLLYAPPPSFPTTGQYSIISYTER